MKVRGFVFAAVAALALGGIQAEVIEADAAVPQVKVAAVYTSVGVFAE